MQSLAVDQLQAFAQGESHTLLLDVREPWEVQTARISLPGVATLAIPMNEIPARLAEIDPSQSIVCICHHGARSAQVVALLLRQGYTDVYNLSGGVDAWSLRVDPGVPRY
jgi:rhodanese-related sulfurtransferase